MAQATVGNKGNVPWAAWLTDYAVIRDAIAETYPDVFKDFNKRLARPGGFQKPIPARERIWKTKSGKANFLLPESLEENEDVVPSGGDILQLITIRSNGQFNTTLKPRSIADSTVARTQTSVSTPETIREAAPHSLSCAMRPGLENAE